MEALNHNLESVKEEEINKNGIVKLTLEFSIAILDYCELLQGLRKYVLLNQLMRAGTSLGANVWEAQNAESKPDFIHKFKIAAKEMDETKYWLLLCSNLKSCPDTKILMGKLEHIHRIITKIVSTSKRKKSNNAQLAN